MNHPFIAVTKGLWHTYAVPSLYCGWRVETPPFKEGDKQKVRNYRPFSLKYVISNILESVTQGATAGHLDKGKKIKGETVLYQFARDL